MPGSNNKATVILKLNSIAKIILIIASIILFATRSWTGEDAFIFFRYVDNLVNGNGLVFNFGERVEGFTSPLWIFVLSLIRLITNFDLRPTAIILGIILSTISITLLLFFDNSKKVFFPLGIILLMANSAFRDFATSGFETSLIYLLITAFAILIKKSLIYERPFLAGLILSLLILARPETLLLIPYALILLVTEKKKYIKTDESKPRSKFKQIILFFVPIMLIVGGYQIFRMGYYASFFPNTYYAKKGGEIYMAQGMHYLSDFIKSYKISFSIILIIIIGTFRFDKGFYTVPHKLDHLVR